VKKGREREGNGEGGREGGKWGRREREGSGKGEQW